LRGLAAGLVATAAVSVAMALKSMLGVLVEADLIRLVSAAFNLLFGTPHTPALGWLLHVLVGVVWGLAFAWICDRLPGRSGAVRGIVFALWPWLAMMLVLMPIAGAGWFALALGPLAMAWLLLLHLLFGAVLGMAHEGLARDPGGVARTPTRVRPSRTG
jgi:hypothetical protein